MWGEEGTGASDRFGSWSRKLRAHIHKSKLVMGVGASIGVEGCLNPKPAPSGILPPANLRTHTPKPPQIPPPTGDQVFRCQSLVKDIFHLNDHNEL